jgi:hypothetical protein
MSAADLVVDLTNEIGKIQQPKDGGLDCDRTVA